MLLTKLYIVNIDITKRYRDPFVLSYNESNRLLIVAKDRLELTKL
jgi:hypothetical protein